jgi:hypothetical protein
MPSPSTSLQDITTTSVHVATSSSIDPDASSIVGLSFTQVTVIVTVAEDEVNTPSLTTYPKVSTPHHCAIGSYVNEPSKLKLRTPLEVVDDKEAIILSQSASLSFCDTPEAALTTNTISSTPVNKSATATGGVSFTLVIVSVSIAVPVKIQSNQSILSTYQLCDSKSRLAESAIIS